MQYQFFIPLHRDRLKCSYLEIADSQLHRAIQRHPLNDLLPARESRQTEGEVR
jgi:hypothetical protein